MRLLARLLFSTLLAGPIAAAASSDHSTPALAGTWTLKAAYDLHQDGSKTFGFGAQPTGILMIDAQGRYSLQVFRSNEPTFATDEKGARKAFNPGELASTHNGTVSLDAAARTVTFRIDHSYIQRWNATVQVRPYTWSGDELSYQVPAQPGSDSVAVSVWQRADNGQPLQSRNGQEPSPPPRARGTDLAGP